MRYQITYAKTIVEEIDAINIDEAARRACAKTFQAGKVDVNGVPTNSLKVLSIWPTLRSVTPYIPPELKAS
jgi:hypothetical protein